MIGRGEGGRSAGGAPRRLPSSVRAAAATVVGLWFYGSLAWAGGFEGTARPETHRMSSGTVTHVALDDQGAPWAWAGDQVVRLREGRLRVVPVAERPEGASEGLSGWSIEASDGGVEVTRTVAGHPWTVGRVALSSPVTGWSAEVRDDGGVEVVAHTEGRTWLLVWRGASVGPWDWTTRRLPGGASMPWPRRARAPADPDVRWQVPHRALTEVQAVAWNRERLVLGGAGSGSGLMVVAERPAAAR